MRTVSLGESEDVMRVACAHEDAQLSFLCARRSTSNTKNTHSDHWLIRYWAIAVKLDGDLLAG